MENKRLQGLNEWKNATIEAMRGLISKADEEQRDITEAENQEYARLEGALVRCEEAIIKEEDLAAREATVQKLQNPLHRPNVRNVPVPPGEWRGLGEFFQAIAMSHYNARHDPRLDEWRVSLPATETRAQQFQEGALGGFALPTQFRPTLLQIQPQAAIIRPLASVIPAGEPPDAEISMPALDQVGSSNVYGGVVVYNTGEMKTLTETNLKLREVKLKPEMIAAYMYSSNKLLNNWQAAGALFQAQLTKAMNGKEDYDFLRGDGVDCATGVINSACKITIDRTTAAQIARADVVNMFVRAKFGGRLVWIASQTCLPQLMAIVDPGTAGTLIWAKDLVSAIPNTILGYPVLINERSPALGSEGDLILADLSYYLIKDGSGPFFSVSEHVRFTSDQTCFKIVWNVDGAAWLTQALPLEGATSNTVSPIVVLK